MISAFAARLEVLRDILRPLLPAAPLHLTCSLASFRESLCHPSPQNRLSWNLIGPVTLRLLLSGSLLAHLHQHDPPACVSM